MRRRVVDEPDERRVDPDELLLRLVSEVLSVDANSRTLTGGGDVLR
ncbi:hypothetical protein [Brevundimonas goettingensis]|uniref:Uncharacterized protein n=1 Tax=Brevundimonas goettingensis TaxID=2774190 RepID=A0A975BZG9_9CAUL|nr:hypothetical protein [Brevundimonas goettingensis]QTC90470.1 hypothetical protein IFJ75_14465 [Brevundimonas goettingensis]